MTQREPKMICPGCGVVMNRHAAKIVQPTSAEERRLMDPELGGLIAESHTCPGCGGGAARRRGPEPQR